MIKRYKFLRTRLKSNSGNVKWKLGEWKKHEGTLEMCSSGFHCSKTIYQAFSYVQEKVLAEVEVRGKSEIQNDKEVWSEMRIVKVWKWQKKDSLALSIFAAELVLSNYEKLYKNKAPRLAIEAAKKVLFKDTKVNRAAAESAAKSAEFAAWSAAKSAEFAESAAKSAAESAAESAAWSAEFALIEKINKWFKKHLAESAEFALIEKINKWFKKHLKELEEYGN